MERIYSFKKNTDPKFYASDYDINVSKCGVKCGTPLRF